MKPGEPKQGVALSTQASFTPLQNQRGGEDAGIQTGAHGTKRSPAGASTWSEMIVRAYEARVAMLGGIAVPTSSPGVFSGEPSAGAVSEDKPPAFKAAS